MASSPFTSAFDELVEQTLHRWHFQGASFAVVHDGHTWCKGYGIAIRETKQAVEPTTLFYVASTTKAQLCAAWSLYMASTANQSKPELERVKWSTPIASIIRDDFVLSDPIRTMQVTLEDAVSHRTGLPRHELSYGYDGVNTPKEVTRNFRHLPLHNDLRTTFEYCNTPFVAASYALETLIGMPLAGYLREKLWTPNGMTRTYGGYNDASLAVRDKGEVLAKGYTWSKLPGDPNEDGGQLNEEAYMGLAEVSGAGYVISCAEDYAKWMGCFLDSSNGPLTPDIIKELWKPRSIDTEDDHDNGPFDGVLTYGLGWFISTYKGHMVYWHTGGLLGAGSYVLLCPDIRFGVTFLANGNDACIKIKGLAIELLDAALDIPALERTGRKTSDESATDLYRGFAKDYAGSREKLYQDAPAKAVLPLALPIEAYAGTYSNPGYGTLTISVLQSDNGGHCLACDLSERTWRPSMTLEHVNAEHWLGTRTSGHNPLKSAFKAESKIHPSAKVEAFRIGMEAAMPELLITFERCN